jgi:hypothetical protein
MTLEAKLNRLIAMVGVNIVLTLIMLVLQIGR